MLIPVWPGLNFCYILGIISSPSWFFSVLAMDFFKKTSGFVFTFLILTLVHLWSAGNFVLSMLYFSLRRNPNTDRLFLGYKATGINKDLNSLYDNSGDYRLKDRYNSCSKNYHDTMRNLDLIKKLFNDRDYERIEVQINDSVEEVRDCKNQLENNDNDSYDLKKRTKEFELLCDVVKVSAKYLEGKDRDDKDRDDEDDEDDD